MSLLFLANLAILIAASCGAFAQTPKEPRPSPSDVAVVEVDGRLSIDFKDREPFWRSSTFWARYNKLEFEPGDHQIGVHYHSSTAQREENSDLIYVSLPNLKAGHTYRVEMKKKTGWSGSRFDLLFTELSPTTVGQLADDRKPENVPELCSIRKVAVVGDDAAAKETRKRVEKKTWMKKVDAPEQADGILDAQVMLTSFSVSMSGNRVASASREGYVSMKLKQRQPEKVLWEGRQDLGTQNLIDALLSSLQQKAGCAKR